MATVLPVFAVIYTPAVAVIVIHLQGVACIIGDGWGEGSRDGGRWICISWLGGRDRAVDCSLIIDVPRSVSVAIFVSQLPVDLRR